MDNNLLMSEQHKLVFTYKINSMDRMQVYARTQTADLLNNNSVWVIRHRQPTIRLLPYRQTESKWKSVNSQHSRLAIWATLAYLQHDTGAMSSRRLVMCHSDDVAIYELWVSRQPHKRTGDPGDQGTIAQRHCQLHGIMKMMSWDAHPGMNTSSCGLLGSIPMTHCKHTLSLQNNLQANKLFNMAMM